MTLTGTEEQIAIAVTLISEAIGIDLRGNGSSAPATTESAPVAEIATPAAEPQVEAAATNGTTPSVPSKPALETKPTTQQDDRFTKMEQDLMRHVTELATTNHK